MIDIPFLLQMAWKSALISGAALALAAALRSRPAADRAAVLRTGVLLLVLLPVIALVLPTLRIEAWAASETPPLLYAGGTYAEPDVPVLVDFQPVKKTIWDDPTLLIVLAYLSGFLALTARLLTGLWTLRSWTESAREVDCPQWLAAFERARSNATGSERLRLLVGDCVPSPLSWGWLQPIILIDPGTLDRPEAAEAILGHEVAHVARRDWLVLIVSRLTTALFWFNPLVWLLEREVVQQAEQAADREAAERVEPGRYAQTLLDWAQEHGAAIPAHGMAPSAPALAHRIRAVLDERLHERRAFSAWTASAIVVCIAFAAPVAAIELVRKERPVMDGKAPPIALRAPSAPSSIPGPDENPRKVSAADRMGAAVLPQERSSAVSATAPVELQATWEKSNKWGRAAGPSRATPAEEIAAASEDWSRTAEALRVRHAEVTTTAREKWQANAESLQMKHAELTTAATEEWRADAKALQIRHAAAVAVEESRANDEALRTGRAEADEAFQKQRRATDEVFRIRRAEADDAFQQGRRVNDEAYQLARAEADNAFRIGSQANDEAYRTRIAEASERFQKRSRASSRAGEPRAVSQERQA